MYKIIGVKLYTMVTSPYRVFISSYDNKFMKITSINFKGERLDLIKMKELLENYKNAAN
jgi:hypothetical protein